MLNQAHDNRYANLAWELFYWIVLASSTFEKYGYSAWFITDVIHTAIMIQYEYAGRRWQATQHMLQGVCLFGFGFWLLSLYNPDHQSSAFWTALAMQAPTSWASLYDVARGEDMKGHSLEIWFVGPVYSFKS